MKHPLEVLAPLALVPLLLACQGAEQREVVGVIGVRNESGRSGAYYVPSGSRTQPMPLLVVLHGSGGSGEAILAQFRPFAQTRRFAIVAPDSRSTPEGHFVWQVADRPGEITADLTHVLSAVEWFRSHSGVSIDPARVLIAGFSAGASSAPYIGSNRPPFTHAAVLHGGVFPGGLGSRRIPVWVSTGEQDRYRPVTLVQQSVNELTRLGFTTTFRAYPGAHDLSEPEIQAVINWWLGP